MTSALHAPHPAEQQAPTYAPPDPRAEAQRLLTDGQALLDEALQKLRGDGGPAATAELVGRASDRIGSALHFLRLATRG